MLALTDALNRAGAKAGASLCHPSSSYVNTIVAPEGSSIAVDDAELAAAGVQRIVYVDSHADSKGRCLYDEENLVVALNKLLRLPPAEGALRQSQRLGVEMMVP